MMTRAIPFSEMFYQLVKGTSVPGFSPTDQIGDFSILEKGQRDFASFVR